MSETALESKVLSAVCGACVLVYTLRSRGPFENSRTKFKGLERSHANGSRLACNRTQSLRDQSVSRSQAIYSTAISKVTSLDGTKKHGNQAVAGGAEGPYRP